MGICTFAKGAMDPARSQMVILDGSRKWLQWWWLECPSFPFRVHLVSSEREDFPFKMENAWMRSPNTFRHVWGSWFFAWELSSGAPQPLLSSWCGAVTLAPGGGCGQHCWSGSPPPTDTWPQVFVRSLGTVGCFGGLGFYQHATGANMAGFQHPTLMINWSCDGFTLTYTHPAIRLLFMFIM